MEVETKTKKQMTPNTNLLQSLAENETTRTNHLNLEGKAQITYQQSTDGWIPTVFLIKGRALDHVYCMWILVVLNSIIAIVLQQHAIKYQRDISSWELFFSFVLNATLSLLLVFRLNRAADRFWSARIAWGEIVAYCRCYVGMILSTYSLVCTTTTVENKQQQRQHRDDSIRWLIAFVICTMEFVRGQKQLPDDNFAGILNENEIRHVEQQTHPPMYAIDQARYHLNQMFHIIGANVNVTTSIALSYTQQLNLLEQQLILLIQRGG